MLAGIPVHVGGVLAVLGPFVLGLTIAPLATNLSAALVSTLLFGALCAVLLVLLVPVVTRLQRSRMSELAAVRITAAQVRAGTGWRAYARALRSEALWRQAFYHAVVGPVISFGALAAFAVWPAGIVLAAVPLYAWALPSASPMNFGAHPAGVAGMCGLGLALVTVGPWLADRVARWDLAAGRALLGPNRARALQARVDHLAVSRAALLEAATAERKRIERDLHDGVQQRLVSLAMRLGMARVNLPDLSPQTRGVLDQLHAEAKQTLQELRDLVRGLHPAVLQEQGLDAALSGIAARSPLPVRLRVGPDARAEPAIEAVAYFVVSEALTNIAKHARAEHAEIALERDGDILRLTVADDGVGGADSTAGSGLAGLASRVDSVDGRFTVDSRPGKGTEIIVELPCVL